MSRRYEDEDEDEEYMRPMLPTVPDKCGPPTITLGLLIDFAVQQTYHELTVLAELLPKKMDADRKISIVEFAHSTRTLFIKLLAVVKWLKSSKKFDSCSSICYFLDQQSQYFIDTADYLVTLAREELEHARLPAFQVPCAVDVLTSGDYPKLPVCITQNFMVDRSITQHEEAGTLQRLGQVLKTRLSQASAMLSPRIRKIVFKNGMVNLIVPGEFEVSLTLLGERLTTKWTLLNIRFLVQDYEIGFGTSLIHPLQVNSIHNLLQLRMDQSEEPLREVYNILHAVAQSLQLDILFCQATQVISGHMRNFAVIENYNREEGYLVLAYWLRWTKQKRYVTQYRIKISTDSKNPHSGLRIQHYPPNEDLPIIDDRSGRLSMNRILSETVAVRCVEKLLRIRRSLESIKPLTRVMLTGNATCTLTYPLLEENPHISEMLVVSVSGSTGRIEAVVAMLGACKEVAELAKCFNDGASLEKIASIVCRLRVLLMIERFRKAVASLPVRIVDESVVYAQFSSLQIVPSDRLCLQFIKEDIYFLIVSFVANSKGKVDVGIYLFSSSEGKTNMLCLHPSQMLETWTSSNFRSIDGHPATQRQKWLGSTKQVTSAVAAIDDRLAFMRLCEELDKRRVKHLPLGTEAIVGGLILRITDFTEAISSTTREFFSLLINCCLRLDTRAKVIWPFEYTLAENPLIPDYYECTDLASCKAEKTKTTVLEIYANAGVNQMSTSESVYQSMIEKLIVYSHMYDVTKQFSRAYYGHFHKFCNISAFTYYKLVIAYGELRNNLMMLTWKVQKVPKPSQYFHLTFGMGTSRDFANGRSTASPDRELLWNPHTVLQTRLQDKFNRKPSLTDLMQYLIDTVEPLSCLCKFAHMRIQSVRTYAQMMGFETALPILLQTNLVPVDETTIRLSYNSICLEFLLLTDSKVGVRDASRKNAAAAHLRAFCNKYVNSELVSTGMHDTHSPSAASWLRSPSGPSSLPHHMGRSPAVRQLTSSPMSHMSLSVPPSELEMSPMRHAGDHASLSRTPIVIDHYALRRMTTTDASGSCPLEEYLHAVSYLARLGPALESHQNDARIGANPHIVFRFLRYTPDSVRLSVPSATPQSHKHDTFILNMNIYLDEETMSLKIKLDYEGDNIPTSAEIRVAERYFERCVARVGSELAVIAFANACRLAVPGTFSAITQIMDAQMEWTEDSPWKPSLQLVSSSSDGITPRMRVTPGLLYDPTNVSIIVLLCLRPTRPDPKERNAEASKHVLPLIYNTQMNVVNRRSPSGDEARDIAPILASVSEQCARTNEVALWPAVRNLAYRYMQG